MAIKTAAELKAYFETGDVPTQAQFIDLIDTIFTAVPTYKVYRALLTQTGTGAPVVTVIQNTLGVTPTWSYVGIGEYQLDSIGLFTLNKTTAFIGGVTSFGATIITDLSNADFVYISTGDSTNNLANDLLNKTSILIIVEN